MINPAEYPPGWRKLRIGSPEKVGDRFKFFYEPGSNKLEDWAEITEAGCCSLASSPEFTVIRRKEKP